MPLGCNEINNTQSKECIDYSRNSGRSFACKNPSAFPAEALNECPAELLIEFPVTRFAILFFSNLIIELLSGFIYLAIRKAKGFGYKLPIIAIVVANIISYPVFYLLTYLFANNFLSVALMEVGVVAFESLVIWLICRKKMNYTQSLLLSVIINVSSILIGLGVSYLLNRLTAV